MLTVSPTVKMRVQWVIPNGLTSSWGVLSFLGIGPVRKFQVMQTNNTA